MWNLILKDLFIQKRTFIIVILASLPIIIAFGYNPGDLNTIYSFIATFSAYSFLANSFYRDEKAEIMLNSLPINRINIIISKYLALFIFILISIVIVFLVFISAQYTGIIKLSWNTSIENICGGLITALFLSCIFLPIYFKYGYLKTRYITMLLFMGIFCIFMASNKILDKKISFILNYLNTIPEGTIKLIIITACFIVLLASFALSYRAYKNRDL